MPYFRFSQILITSFSVNGSPSTTKFCLCQSSHSFPPHCIGENENHSCCPVGSSPRHASNWQNGAVLPTALPSGQILASIVHAIGSVTFCHPRDCILAKSLLSTKSAIVSPRWQEHASHTTVPSSASFDAKSSASIPCSIENHAVTRSSSSAKSLFTGQLSPSHGFVRHCVGLYVNQADCSDGA